MSYIDKVLSRFNLSGLILFIAGAVAVFFSGLIVEKIGLERKDRPHHQRSRFCGCAGSALILLDFIG